MRLPFRITFGRVVVYGVPLLVLIFLIYGSIPNSEFTMDRLGGKPSSEIKHIFGEPEAVLPNDRGPVFIYDDKYKWLQWSYSVHFEHDKVVYVGSGHK